MPSASAKTEKTALLEAADPVKQLSIQLEKKVRNLEKRKLKLDNYKNDVKNGKELNEDQKIAVSKYDQVIEVLEYSKDLVKSLNTISQESQRVQKKLAKKEQIERQQHEIQRLQEALYYRHILSSLEAEDVRNDFLTGENGALKLSEDDLHHLDQFYKLVGPALPNDQADIDGHFHALAENLIFLVDGKNKDIAGTTYKTLKELLKGMKDSGYFSRASEPPEEVSSDDTPEPDDLIGEKQVSSEEAVSTQVFEANDADADVGDTEVVSETEQLESVEVVDSSVSPEATQEPSSNTFTLQNGSLQEVLDSQGSFNFLQESQIELDTPHMDPAVVAVHQMAPPSGMNFTVNQYQGSPAVDELQDVVSNGIDHGDISPPPSQIPAPIPMIANTAQRTIPPVLTSVQHNGATDFDPSHPIPTQTFTNQSYAIMQNMIVPPGAYVPVTMHHGPLPPHMAPIAVVPGLSPTVSSPTSTVPVHVTVASIPITDANSSPVATMAENIPLKDEQDVEVVAVNGNSSGHETLSQNNASSERTSEGEGFVSNYQRNFRGRGRGRGQSNGYYRSRGGYNNGRGGYQGHNNYSQGGNFRRGSYRGRSSGMRGGRGGNGYNNNNNNNNNNRTTQQQQQQQ